MTPNPKRAKKGRKRRGKAPPLAQTNGGGGTTDLLEFKKPKPVPLGKGTNSAPEKKNNFSFRLKRTVVAKSREKDRGE